MRRMFAIAMLAMSLAFPVAALADTQPPGGDGPGNAYHVLNRGSGGYASFDNLVWTDEGPVPGDYFYTSIDFSSQVSRDGGQTYDSKYACVWYEEFSIDEFGEWTGGSFLGGCAEATTISIGKGLSRGQVVAAIPVGDCLLWDEETGECLDFEELGVIDVAMTLTGTGPTYRYHGTSSGGTAGYYQYTFHGSGSNRAAIPSGSITFDGASLIDGATNSWAELFTTKSGYVDIWIGHP